MLDHYTQFLQVAIVCVPKLGPSFKETKQEEAPTEVVEALVEA